MSIRRMMLFTLIGNLFKDIIASFKNRVINDSGAFEAETNLESQLNNIGKDLFDSASLVITPNGVKTSKLYAIKPNDGTGDLTVVRATTATRVDENGNIVNVPANVARIDYSTGQPAILVETQRTNLVYPSDIATTQVRAVTAVLHTLSFYGTGTVTLSGAFSGSLVGTGANNRVSLTFTPTAGNLTLTVSGSVANWQLEAGSNATSLIKTISGSVTRNADVISNTKASTLIGQTEGTILFKTIVTNFSLNKGVFELNGGTSANFVALDIIGSSRQIQIVTQKNNGGLNIRFTLSNSINLGVNNIAISYTTTGVVLAVNGVILTLIGTGINLPDGNMTRIHLGHRRGLNVFNDYINISLIKKTTSTNSELIAMTTL